MKKIIVIGAGIAGLSAACCLAKEGFEVTVLEKNDTPGGRVSKFESGGFVFDMGPSWYWMPDVFEKFFERFGKKVSDYYQLKRLDPSYRVYFGPADFLNVPAGMPALAKFFESLERGSAKALSRFLHEGASKYALSIGQLVYKPELTWWEFADPKLIRGLLKLHVFQPFSSYVKKLFKNPRIINLLEFPVLFLGAAPANTPALYSLINYADMALGTWYPAGGMYEVVEAMVKLAEELGVKFIFKTPVTGVEVTAKNARGVWSDGNFYAADFIVASADYHHVEKDLIPQTSRQYSDRYWNTRVLTPSCLIFYLGINKRISHLLHHTLFFDEDFQKHIKEIYTDPRWPTAPQFYVCCPSKTDATVAPEGCENVFILIPVAPGLKDDENVREKYFAMVVKRIESLTGESLHPGIVFKRSYAPGDFIRDYNAYKGNAYGLANTLLQTANFKPRIAHKRIDNFFYTGQLTVPGPGVPTCIISGQLTAGTLIKKNKKHDILKR
jgi:phytoene desaturase